MFYSLLEQTERLLQQGLDLLFPPVCTTCRRRGSWLCSTCLQSMQPLTVPVCQQCGSPLASAACFSCRQKLLQLHGLRAVNLYRGVLRRAIHAFKYDGCVHLADPLGLLLARAFEQYSLRADIIVPLPLHKQRRQARGYNQAELLARVCARRLKIACREDLLIRQRITRPQVGLSAQERYQNVAGAFALAPSFSIRSFSGRSFLLIDDVSTTGATLEACASPLYEAGIQAVWGLVLAKPDGQAQLAYKSML